MRYFFLDQTQGWRGPFLFEELCQLKREGLLLPSSPVKTEGSERIVLFKELAAEGPPPLSAGTSEAGATPSSLHNSPFAARSESFADRAGSDLRALLPHLLLPLEELRTFRWVENRTALSFAAVGLLPLVIFALFRSPAQFGNAYWAMALYFSVLWAMFFYKALGAREARFGLAALSFFGSGFVSISVLLLLYRVWPMDMLLGWTLTSRDFLVQCLGFLFGVALPEEFCKALVLFFVARRFMPQSPRAMLFYGLMAGLGFGIYEAVKYQSVHNFNFAVEAVRRNPEQSAVFRAMAEYYLLNLIRLTTLPFLHAIWGGIAGYFIGFAEQFPPRRRGLLIVAIGMPTSLHGCYNAFSGSFFALIIALASVVALVLYFAKSVDFENLLAQRRVR